MDEDTRRPRSMSRRRFAAQALPAAALLALPPIARLAASSNAREAGAVSAIPSPGDVLVLRDVMVPMRDGVALATDIYLPARAGSALSGRFPVVLERTPYDKSAASRSERTPAEAQPQSRAAVAAFFVRRGYAVIYQDCRGRYRSQGTYVKYLSDGRDGYDTCAWILKQPWSNGAIGTMGLSYAAHTQAALASAAAPGVRAMFLDSGGFANAYQGGIRQGGAFELKQVTWAFSEGLNSPRLLQDPAKLAAMRAIDLPEWFARMPWRRGASPLSLVPDYESYVFDQWEHGDFDAFWKQLGIYAAGYYRQFPDAAMMHMSSWYDPYPRTATDNYLGLAPLKRGPVRLILGPWTHGDRQLTYAGNVDFGAAATVDGNLAVDFLTLRLRWFDRWLKGVGNGVESEPAVRIFVMGGGSGRRNAAGRLEHGGRWRAEHDWPLPGTRWTPFYLHGNRRVRPRPHRVRPRRSAMTTTRAIRCRPSAAASPRAGRSWSAAPSISARRRSSSARSRRTARSPRGRTCWSSRASRCAEDLEVTGPMRVRLWIASDCPDTDFTAKLVDVYPPNDDYREGFAMNLTDGVLRVRYRDSWERPALMSPGRRYAIVIDVFPTSNLFRQGHRIRLDISSSNFPRFDANPNTGEPEGRARTQRVARNSVYVGGRHASQVILPVIPART